MSDFPPMSNVELENNIPSAVQHQFKGVWMRNEKPKGGPQNGYYIFNLEPKSKGGSHWVGAIMTPKISYYFDPFGIVPPTEIQAFLKSDGREVYHSQNQIQDKTSTLCGVYVLKWFDWMSEHRPSKDAFYSFLHDHFTDDPKENEMILREEYLDGKNKSIKREDLSIKFVSPGESETDIDGGGLSTQSVVVPKSFGSIVKAKGWLKSHDYGVSFKGKRVDKTPNTYRFRQEDPDKFKDKSYRMKTLPNGVMLVLGELKNSR